MNGDQTTAWRLDRAERDIEKLDQGKAELKDLNVLAEEVRALRRALVAAAITIATASVGFAFTVFELLGRA